MGDLRRLIGAMAAGALLLAGCADGLRDEGGRLMQLDAREATLADSTLFLPTPILEHARSFTQTIRDNQFPIEVTNGDGPNYLKFQYLPGFYRFYSERTARRIQSEEAFRDRMWGRTQGFSGAPVRIGTQTSEVGGYIWRSPRGDKECLAATVGAAFGARRNVGKSVGTPYNAILDVVFCDSSGEAVERVEAFVRDPKLVEDRRAFAAAVAAARD